MDEFLKNLASVGWWLGVVFVGIVLNVFSAYLKSPIDALLSRLFATWSKRSQSAREKHLTAVAALCRSEQLQIMVLVDANRYRLNALLHLAFGLFFLASAEYMRFLSAAIRAGGGEGLPRWIGWLFNAMSLISIFVSMRAMLVAAKRSNLVAEAQRVRSDKG